MTERKLKDFMSEEEEKKRKKSDEEIFESLDLSDGDLKVLKAITLSEDTSLSALINLVLRVKDGQVIKEENKEELLLRGYITENGNVTDEGKQYIESNEIKQRLSELLNE